MSRSTWEAQFKTMPRDHPCRLPASTTKKNVQHNAAERLLGEGKRPVRGETAEKTGTEMDVHEEPFYTHGVAQEKEREETRKSALHVAFHAKRRQRNKKKKRAQRIGQQV